MKVAFIPRQDNEWVEVEGRTHYVTCCDCDLVHKLTFRVMNGRVRFKAERDNRRTANRRRSVA